ncbi:hypothetical protein [Bradyrhizobium viridifuturi]|uniref:hypothetical protein n=1 Tax=Bradyrhizobium viridifuturi TaxID=1654716 RepID=UPI000FE1454D|nr:hypothetical protein [Bradyrhizobium viridifuturi]
MPRFTFSGVPTRVIFGSRTIVSIGSEVERLDRRHSWFAAQQREGGMLRDLLGRSCSDVYSGAVLHTPTSESLPLRPLVDPRDTARGVWRSSGEDNPGGRLQDLA